MCSHRIMRLRVQSVVNGKALLCLQLQILAANARTAAIGKDSIVLRNQLAKRIAGIFFQARESRGGVHIPENNHWRVVSLAANQHSAVPALGRRSYTAV